MAKNNKLILNWDIFLLDFPRDHWLLESADRNKFWFLIVPFVINFLCPSLYFCFIFENATTSISTQGHIFLNLYQHNSFPVEKN